ncbi:MAG: hypothetical protein EOP54_07525 [Sphingobacteriales bacterium]|nr:MAG: hypothetical protein EOP54_07525 [Sphingobacteriales bacterium]
MSKLCVAIKLRYSLPLIFLLPLTTLVYSCSRIKESNIASPCNVVPGKTLGTVSVSIYNTLGIKNEESIARQLEAEAQKLYPGSSAITNIRYDKSIAYADVVQ